MKAKFLIAGVMILMTVLGLYAARWRKSSTTPLTTKLVSQPKADEPAPISSETAPTSLIPASDARTAPPLASGEWINSSPLTLDELRGRVVLIDFWTFGCYNCRNTLPALKRFDTSYRERGLTIIGVHSPEFERERKIENVKGEVAALEIKYPVVTDNAYETWDAYGIEGWPTVVILDKQGRIRFKHVGEGLYDEQEKVINALLAEGQ